MSKFKKIFATMIGTAMSANVLLTMPFSVFADNISETFEFDGYTVGYEVKNSWGNTEVVSLTLTNTGTETIEDWMLYFDPNGEIQYVNDAVQMTTTNGIGYIKNPGYNVDIDPGASVEFRYAVNDCEEIPSNYKFCQSRMTKENGYAVSLKVNYTWGSNNEYFNGEIIIRNDTDAPIEAWELKADTNFTITEITNSWAADVTELESYNYMLKGTYTSIIPAGGSISLGFNGMKEGEPIISDYSMTEVVVDESIINSIINGSDKDDEFYNDYINWSTLPDTDGDGLPDEYEEEYGCDPANPDTDGDGLPDGYEIITIGSNPSDAYSLDNILSDGEYDNDQDGLSNYEEYLLGTDPLRADSDFDGLSDGDEVNVYDTDPLNPDTDGDGLSDGDEIALGLNPLVTDSNGDGIPDNEEKFSQSMTYDTEDSDTVIDSINVSFDGTGYINSTTSFENIMDIDWMCSNVVGLVGNPYNISSDSSFDTATLTFNVDKSSLGDIQFEDLAVLWYNEEEQRFVEMETIPDVAASTLTTTVEHFSKYLIVDCSRWYEAWSENNYPLNGNTLHTAITIDCSSSMIGNDPNNYRITAANSFVDVMNAADLASVIFFADGADEKQELTNNQEALKNAIDDVFSAGTTNYTAALRYSIDSLEKQPDSNADNIIIFLSDGRPTNVVEGVGIEISEDEFDYSLVDEAASKGIRIYTIGLTNGVNEKILREMSRRTNGEYYYANTAKELISYFLTVSMGEKYDIITDTDEDGIPDLFETYGMPVANGQVLFSDPEVKDTDGDGLEDGEEVIMHIVDDANEVKAAYNYMYGSIPEPFISSNGGIYFTMVANPEKECSVDDGINDFDKLHPEKIFDKYKSDYYSQNHEYYDFYDDSEYYYEHLENRYKERNALKPYTVETLFPELKNSSLNSSSNSTYLVVNDNNIEIHVNLMLWDSQYIETKPSNESDYNYNKPASQILSEINDGDTRTLREAFIDGLKYHWEKSFTGSLFNFYPGMKINTSIVIHDFTGTDSYYDDGTNHKNRMYAVLHSEPGRSYMTVNEINIFCARSMIDFYRSSSHEFGHILGLADYYSDAGYEIPFINDVQLDPEIRKHGLMNSGYPNLINLTTNDVEMAIYGAFDNSFFVSQSYIPGRGQKISAALREKIMYSKNGTKYEWVEDSYFVPVVSGIENNGLFRYYVDNGNVTIIGLDEGLETAENINIPSEINGYPVKFINGFSFENNNYITSVTIPNTVVEIGDSAFKECSNLTTVSLSSGIIRIDGGAFYNCEKLSNFTIPAGVEYIGNSAFYNCHRLVNLTIPESVEKIDAYAFNMCWFSSHGTITFERTTKNDYNRSMFWNDRNVTVRIPNIARNEYEDDNGEVTFSHVPTENIVFYD